MLISHLLFQVGALNNGAQTVPPATTGNGAQVTQQDQTGNGAQAGNAWAHHITTSDI